ncbi:hypothetical protein CQA66_02890 [Helicobacter aurati]|uniref:Tat pathway signal protein n=1 Tax=Helicobacter aurati TaxID=137778 RepID=A0A3D8J5T2_9HELI|nr:twin-arginine translocation signal domain-containing protein [Helicobacter aurati]RDU72852.1 hypothetical protein CQA66_02890 [Helicobacter aurati]
MQNRRKLLKTLTITGAVIGTGISPVFAQNNTRNKGEKNEKVVCCWLSRSI